MSSSGTSAEIVARLDYPMAIVTCPGPSGRLSGEHGPSGRLSGEHGPSGRLSGEHGPSGRPSGCLVGFWTQCSIDPVRFLVCVSKANHTHGPALRAPAVAVHVLDDDDCHLAEVFGELTGDVVDKLSLVRWTPGPDAVPVLDDAAAWFAGRVVDRVDLGDHTGLVVEPMAGAARRWSGQLGYQAIKAMPPGHAP